MCLLCVLYLCCVPVPCPMRCSRLMNINLLTYLLICYAACGVRWRWITCVMASVMMLASNTCVIIRTSMTISSTCARYHLLSPVIIGTENYLPLSSSSLNAIMMLHIHHADCNSVFFKYMTYSMALFLVTWVHTISVLTQATSVLFYRANDV